MEMSTIWIILICIAAKSGMILTVCNVSNLFVTEYNGSFICLQLFGFEVVIVPSMFSSSLLLTFDGVLAKYVVVPAFLYWGFQFCRPVRLLFFCISSLLLKAPFSDVLTNAAPTFLLNHFLFGIRYTSTFSVIEATTFQCTRFLLIKYSANDRRRSQKCYS